MEDEKYFYTGTRPINPRLMREVVCDENHQHNGLCYVATKPVPPEVQERVKEWMEREGIQLKPLLF